MTTSKKKPALVPPMNYALLRVELVVAVEVNVCDDHANLAYDEAEATISDAVHMMHLGVHGDLQLLGTNITRLVVTEASR